MECIFQEFDKWAYDIEQEYKNSEYITPKKKRQYINICRLRDKYYDLYLKNLEEMYRWDNNFKEFPKPKCCKDRFYPKCLKSQ